VSLRRSILGPFVARRPTGARVRTRLFVTGADDEVLTTVGRHLGGQAGVDLGARCGSGRGDANRADRKRSLTAASSSRWAGAITRTSNDQWALGMRNLVAQGRSLGARVARIEKRLAVCCGERQGGMRGYHDAQERFQKQRRLQVLKARLAEVESRIDEGRVSVCRGGARLARVHHNLEASDLTEAGWRQRWEAARLFVTADGEADKRLGNETIRWDPSNGWLELRLPSPLAHLANCSRGRYRIEGVAFPYRGDEVAAQTVAGAVRYDIRYDPVKGRWYLDASWSVSDAVGASMDGAGVVGVDLNEGHLAGSVLDAAGNPYGRPWSVRVDLAGLPTSTRDGRLRSAISEVLRRAASAGCKAIVIENLDFEADKATSKETHGRGRRGRRFRRTVHGLPVARFRDRLVQMAANAGISVIAVDPAYTSRWGAEHWQVALQTNHPTLQISRHHAASVVIARRGLGHKARRRTGVPQPQRIHGDERATAQAAPEPTAGEETRPREGGRASPLREEDSRPATRTRRATRTPKTVRGVRVSLVGTQ